MKPEQKPLSARITGRVHDQATFYTTGKGFSRINANKEEFIWANKYRASTLPLFHLELAGVTYADPSYRLVRDSDPHHHSENMFVLEYVTAGKGYIESRGVRSELCAGDLYLVDCRFPHRYFADEEEPFEKKWLNIRGSLLNAMAPLILQETCYAVLPLGEGAGSVMDEIHRRIRCATPADSEAMLTEVMKLILELFMMMDRYRRDAQQNSSQIERIVSYIEQNICLDIHVSDLVDYFYISTSTLYRLFINEYGMSPKEFILHKKIEVSKQMIAEGDSNFQTIATVLNFYDAHHFCRVFKRRTGMNPTEYRAGLASETVNSAPAP